jgi:hypothetical protein
VTVTSPSSVFILGAGASAAFGLPLGAQLLHDVRAQIARELHSIKSDRERGYADGGLYGFWRRPVISTLQRLNQHNPDRLSQLQTLLADQTSETIDDFIVENGTYSNLTKLTIAAILFRCCHTDPARDNDRSSVRNFATRHFDFGKGSRRNWIHLFINLVRQGIRLGEVSSNNKVQIITFNYDCILEWVLDAQFSNTESQYGDWREYIEITHVHGQFLPLSKADTIISDPFADICCWSEGIHVVHEGHVPDQVRDARNKARELVCGAREIYAAGFAFAGGNAALLGLRDQPGWGGKRIISYCNWNGDIGLRKSVEKVCRWNNPKTTVDEGQGTVDQPLEIEAWIRAGYLGEMPA